LLINSLAIMCPVWHGVLDGFNAFAVSYVALT